MKFYKPDSQEYNDAEELKEIFEEKKELLLSGKEDGKKNEFVITVEPLVVTTHVSDHLLSDQFSKFPKVHFQVK